MKYDTIALQAALDESPGDSQYKVHYHLNINGREFHPEHPLDLNDLVKSCQSSGELDIFTCGCGIPDCAGIFQGIEVGHTPDEITWKCPNPLSVSEHLPELWEHGVTNFEYFSFEPDQYIDTIDSGIKKIKSLAISSSYPIDFPVYDVKLEQIMALETRPFSTRILDSDRKILAREIVVEANHDFVTVGGVVHQLENLNLGAALTQEYSAWKSISVFPSDISEIPAYLEYLQRGRSFCRALRKHIGRQTAVKLKYHPPSIYNQDAWEVIENIR